MNSLEALPSVDTAKNKLRSFLESENGLGIEMNDEDIKEIFHNIEPEKKSILYKEAGLSEVEVENFEILLKDEKLQMKWPNRLMTRIEEIIDKHNDSSGFDI